MPGSSQISVQCTNNNAYSLALNGGTVGGNVLARKMKHSTAADTVGYQLYQGSNYAIVWGDATGGSPMAGLGTGAAQSYTVYGLCAAAGHAQAGQLQRYRHGHHHILSLRPGQARTARPTAIPDPAAARIPATRSSPGS